MTNGELIDDGRLVMSDGWDEYTECMTLCEDCMHFEVYKSRTKCGWCKALGCIRSTDGFCEMGEEKDATD